MPTTRILILAGLGVVTLGGAVAGVTGAFDQRPYHYDRVSLAMPPSLDMVAFDGEQTVINTTFGPAMPQAVQLTVTDVEQPSTTPPPLTGEEEPPMPKASPVPLVEGPVAAPEAPKPAHEAMAPPATGEAMPSVNGLRVGHTEDKTRIIVDLSGSTDFAYSVGKDGKSVSIVLPGATWKAAAKGSTKAGGRITGYEYQAVDGGSKVILQASEPVEILNVEPHSSDNGQGYQLVVDLIDVQGAQARRGGMTFWTTKETPPKMAEAPPAPPAPAAPPAPRVADAMAAKAEPLPMADYKKARDWSGFYAGIQSGYDWARAKETHSVRGSKSSTVNGPEGGLFLGWGQQYGSLYFGAELAGAFAYASAKQAVNDGKHELSKDWNYSGALRIGTPVFDNGLIYVKGGYQASRFTLNSNRPNDTGAPFIKDSKWTGGPMAGLGFDYLVADNWFVRADASYVFYSAMKYTDSAGGTGKITPSDINLRVGVGYKF